MNVRKINGLLESAKRELREGYDGWELEAVIQMMRKIVLRLPTNLRRKVQIQRKDSGVVYAGDGEGGAWNIEFLLYPHSDKQVLMVQAGDDGDTKTFAFTPSTDPNGTLMSDVVKWMESQLW